MEQEIHIMDYGTLISVVREYFEEVVGIDLQEGGFTLKLVNSKKKRGLKEYTAEVELKLNKP